MGLLLLLIVIGIVACIWCARFNSNAFNNQFGSRLNRLYFDKFGADAKQKMYTEHRNFRLSGPLGSLGILLTKLGLDLDWWMPLALKKRPETAQYVGYGANS